MKTLKLLLLLFVPLFVKAQTVQYLGTNNNIVEVRNAFTLPKDSLGWGNIRLKDTTLQYKVGSSWRVVGSGGGTSVDSSNFQKISNKVTTLTNSATQYPSTSAIRDSIYTKSFTYTKSQTDSAITAKQVFAKNGLRKQGDTVKLGVELAPPYTNGLITETTYLIGGNISGGQLTGVIIDPSNKSVRLSAGSPFAGVLVEKGQFTLSDTSGRSIQSLETSGGLAAMQISATGENLTLSPEGSKFFSESGLALSYDIDYSARFNSNDRSIPDVGWVKGLDTNVVSSAGTLTLTKKGYYSFNGTTTTWTLGAVAPMVTARYVIANMGSGSITINAPSGTLWEAGTTMSSTTINAGETAIIYSNGIYWTIYN